ncbi:hypothetical protein N658DRAFT_81891 [Parathielavia hyrcaniae]|uniref:Uncharacterized protein n=1 Tax=Parathielavia hyrcaniae TaxID=113614 RepID=A0AAN6PRU5_9PEZI|nr:hypothetical protein N658DRAFT_81891 [Parathielavia hyrcaniae]
MCQRMHPKVKYACGHEVEQLPYIVKSDEAEEYSSSRPRSRGWTDKRRCWRRCVATGQYMYKRERSRPDNLHQDS